MNRKLVILYSDNDEQWKNKLKNQIDVLFKAGKYDIEADYWSESRIEPGEEWHRELEPVINQADLVLLILSGSFLDSPLLRHEKIKDRLRSKQKGGFPILLLIIEKCPWRRYSWLKSLPLWPGSGKYLSDFSDSAVDETLDDIADEIVSKLKLKSLITEGILSFLGLKGVGHVKDLYFNPDRRLNVITGNNAYGKTFLLECAWWALTGKWADMPVRPPETDPENNVIPEAAITVQLTTTSGAKGETETLSYDKTREDWSRDDDNMSSSGLAVYARVDGSFTVWDPVRKKKRIPDGFSREESPLFFEHQKAVFYGIEETSKSGGRRSLCNGLLADWLEWQQASDPRFELFEKILETLSCSRQEPLIPGSPVRIAGDTRPMPSLKFPYGTVPVIHAASSVQRMISLAYLVIFLWHEHKLACAGKQDTYKNLVVLIDELDGHLHPEWQRTIISSLLAVNKYLGDEVNIQFLVTTHSPLVLASLEPVFDDAADKLFHLELEDREVLLKEIPFVMQGVVDNWITSPSMGLSQARSLEAEQAVMDADNIQLKENPTVEEVKEIHNRLARYLGDFDTYWPHWMYFAEEKCGKKFYLEQSDDSRTETK